MATLSVPAFLFDQAIDCLGLYYVLMKQQKASLAQVKILGKYCHCLYAHLSLHFN